MEDLAAQTGLQRAIDSSNATYARLHGTNAPHSLPCSYKALTPCPITPGMVTHHPVAFHIKPWPHPSRAKEGVFSVEALREWTCGYGPVRTLRTNRPSRLSRSRCTKQLATIIPSRSKP